MIAFVFPGQGSQIVGMGKALADEFAVARETFEEADAALGESLSRLCWEGPAETLALTANAQPAILAHSIAVWRTFNAEHKLTPALLAGHSLGEYSALVVAGTLPFADALRLVRLRGTLMQDAVPAGTGAMAAVMGMAADAVEALCKEAAQGRVLSPANFNGAIQTVISGHADAVDRAVALAEARGAVAKKLNVSAPFHCALMQPAAAGLAAAMRRLTFADASIAVVSNVDAAPHQDANTLAELLVQQVCAPVRWEACTQTLAQQGATRVIEFGADTLVKLIKRIAPALTRTSLKTPDEIRKFQ